LLLVVYRFKLFPEHSYTGFATNVVLNPHNFQMLFVRILEKVVRGIKEERHTTTNRLSNLSQLH